jgi:Kdo2-lipid IVA lauroyltransferase/acyltransferase
MSKKGKSKSLQVVEYVAFYVTVSVARALPVRVLRVISGILGYALFAAIPRRRKLALQNIKIALGDTMSEKQIRRLALQSCKAFFLTAVEMIKSPYSPGQEGLIHDGRYKGEHLESLFQKAKKIHDDAGGCIFVTPHLGNWELLPFVSASIGIPLVIVIRPLDNPYLERAILSSRIGSGHLMIPKMNAMFSLERELRKGKSVALLPDQSNSKGLRVDFFGKSATVTPVPGLLAVRHRRPVVVVAACRTIDPYHFEGFVSDPIWPDPNGDERSEIVRITREMNLRIEEIIRKFPEQYLWMHNRWKEPDRKPIFGNRAAKL